MAETSAKEYIPLPPYKYDTSNTILSKADDFSLIRFDHNRYCVPYTYAHKVLSIKGYGNRIEIYSHGLKIAEYTRDYRRNQTNYRLEHYLPLIEKRPRSIYNAAPIKDTIPSDLYGLLMKIDNPKEILKLLKMYLSYGDRIIESVKKHKSVDFIEAELLGVKPVLQFTNELKVNRSNLNNYDNLIKGGAVV